MAMLWDAHSDAKISEARIKPSLQGGVLSPIQQPSICFLSTCLKVQSPEIPNSSLHFTFHSIKAINHAMTAPYAGHYENPADLLTFIQHVPVNRASLSLLVTLGAPLSAFVLECSAN